MVGACVGASLWWAPWCCAATIANANGGGGYHLNGKAIGSHEYEYASASTAATSGGGADHVREHCDIGSGGSDRVHYGIGSVK